MRHKLLFSYFMLVIKAGFVPLHTKYTSPPPPPLPSPSGADNPGPGDNVWSDLSRDVPPYEEGRHTQRPRRQKHLVRTCLLIVLMSLVTRVPYSGARLCVRGESLVSFIM